MKKIFAFIIILVLFLSVNPSFAANQTAYFNNEKLAYDAAYQLKRAVNKLDNDINQCYREIKRTKMSKNLSENQKQIKIRKLKREIISKENEKRKLKSKCRQIIS